MVYLDTSVLVAYYCPEALSRQVQNLMREEVKPALSSLTEVEFFSAFQSAEKLDIDAILLSISGEH